MAKGRDMHTPNQGTCLCLRPLGMSLQFNLTSLGAPHWTRPSSTARASGRRYSPALIQVSRMLTSQHLRLTAGSPPQQPACWLPPLWHTDSRCRPRSPPASMCPAVCQHDPASQPCTARPSKRPPCLWQHSSLRCIPPPAVQSSEARGSALAATRSSSSYPSTYSPWLPPAPVTHPPSNGCALAAAGPNGSSFEQWFCLGCRQTQWLIVRAMVLPCLLPDQIGSPAAGPMRYTVLPSLLQLRVPPCRPGRSSSH